MKSPIPYFGSKQSVSDWIVSLFPPHQHYVEPYCGGLSVLLAKPQSPMETVNDLDGDLMTFWRVLRDQPEDLARACALTPHSRAELTGAWEQTSDEVERARRVWVRLSQGRGGMMRRSGWRHYTTTSGSSFSMPDHLDAYRGRLLPAAQRIAPVSLECLPALTMIGKYGAAADVLLYVDPPYLGTTRSHRNRYGPEMRDEAQHRELAAALVDCKATVVLSGYRSPLYAELYEGWHCYEQQSTTGNGTGDRTRTEVLWTNRRLGQQLDLFDQRTAAGFLPPGGDS
ncbi:DNA adenine methylase [Streptomyces sp. NPDC093109]|uniref:DNA adenine methylase n=1 Tax=Streptomyces sp. NPDC093109 TaxID=3154977 RepID=UPI0034510AA1